MTEETSSSDIGEDPVVVFDDQAVTSFPEDDDPAGLVGDEVAAPREILLPEFSDVDPPTPATPANKAGGS